MPINTTLNLKYLPIAFDGRFEHAILELFQQKAHIIEIAKIILK